MIRPLILIVATVFAVPNAFGQSVVQLPSFQTFGYSGTVLVPDGGTASLGGVKRSATHSSRNGMGRSYSSTMSHPHASVTAIIIDLNEMDRQILGGTPEQFLRAERRKEQRRGRRIQRPADPDREGKALVRYARKQYRDGKRSASFDAYRMAIARLSPRLRELAAAEFRRVFGTAADQTIRLSALQR